MIDQQKAEEAYKAYIEKATNDDRIIGIILAGGRGKGLSTENSDYDVILVTTDEGFEGVKNDYHKTEYIDSLPHAISEFKTYAITTKKYDKYTFTHNKALVDKTGEIQKLVEEKGVLEPEEANKIANYALGGYLNSLHRSLKNFRDGNKVAGHLDAVETIPRLITFIFSIENRVTPYNKFLKWELENYPLTKMQTNTLDFLQKIQTIIETGDVNLQKELYEVIKGLALENGHSDEIAGWEGYYFG